MDAATLNARVYAGRAKAAQRIGTPFTIYRPAGTVNPLTASQGGTFVALNAADNSYRKPNLYGHPIWFADMDGRLVNTGDYLVSADSVQIYFVGAKQSLLPIVAIECNQAVRITRAVETPGAVGSVGYSGLCDSAGEAVNVIGQQSPFIGWPCSMLLGKGNEKATNALPAGTRQQPGWMILLPVSAPAGLGIGDRLVDANNRIYSIQQAELTDMGYRIIASEVHG
ncbi:hypothetical protein [Sphingomonas sp. 10B4]|uniref:hypothetical protein n=1 Tax=Sphingomonas sp. 10B4 TaxID=3048575 RepID=UPI002AB39572|nr:hypothetical protein [Sphingomonas sp. 10B4]MDY7525492.1 hypothetical protein [Sphingomonas sp. 10B4]MEB0281436.1 hypothetical protein [Sphingomonas sp. 10B4]